MIAARLSTHFAGAAKPSGPTARDYVQDGLIAMWDGIENAGPGQHDATSTVWKDLTGNGHDFSISSATFSDDSINVSRHSAQLQNGFALGSIATMEASVKTRTSGYCIIFFNARNRIIYDGDGQRMQFNPATNGSTVDEVGASTYSATVNPSDGNIISAYADGLLSTVGNFTSWNNGDNNWLTVNYSQYTFVGAIRFIRLYSRALSAAEIAANYAVDKARFNLP